VSPAAVVPFTRIEKIALGVALALALVLMWPLRGYLTDDTFIHLRYAQHMSRGQGLVFNPGERVYGCTSPLWVALLADAMAVGFDGLATAKVIGGISTLLSIALFLQLLRRTVNTPELRALATVAWAGHAWMLRWSLSGMETPLAVALVLAGFVAYTEGQQWGSRPVRTGALWAMAALTRPEAVFLLGLWLIFLIADTENRAGLRRLVFGALPPLLIYGSWLLFARVYFGTFWPQTLSAKAAGSQAAGFPVDNLIQQAKIVVSTDGLLLLLLVLGLVFGGRRLWPKQVLAQRLLPWVWVVTVPVLYVARGVPVISRYLLPLLPVMGWLAWRTAEIWWCGDAPSPARRARAVTFAALVTVIVLGQNFVVYRTRVVPHVRAFSAGLENTLVHWGKWFRRVAPPGAAIATPDIGALAYYSDLPVVDLGGLVTPPMVPILERETPENAIANLSFSSFAKPEFLVDRALADDDLRRRSRFGPCLTRLGSGAIDGLGISQPETTIYTFYRVDWSCADTASPDSSGSPRR
jgi:hypothetical protein